MKTFFISLFSALLVFSFSFSATAQTTKTGKLKVKKIQNSPKVTNRDSTTTPAPIYRDSLPYLKKNSTKNTQEKQSTGRNGQRMKDIERTPNKVIYRDSLFLKKNPQTQTPTQTRKMSKQQSGNTGQAVTLPGTGKVEGSQRNRKGQNQTAKPKKKNN